MSIIPHRANLIADLENRLRELLDEGAQEGIAFTRVAAEWLGYDLVDDNITDGAGDRGLDFWVSTSSGYEIFQAKSHQLTPDAKLAEASFANDGVNDLRRACELLTDGTVPEGTNDRVRRFLREWNMALGKRRMAPEGDSEHLEVTLTLILFGQGLTPSALEEYQALTRGSPERLVGKVSVHFRFRLLTLDDLLRTRWRETNRDWVDSALRKRETIDLHPELARSEHNWIATPHSAVFYARAFDLVSAFEDFGYQIFEPNVRAHIRQSRVNSAIRESLAHSRTRKEFKFLNNGVTITCTSFRNPSVNRQHFTVSRPGVVNGLQTVVALHQAYSDLPEEERSDLQDNCYVLVRLLDEQAVTDLTKVVLASNNQNPMQPRNLKSNQEEQILYERLFARLGWFYERKQGAWDAFRKDPRRWRTLSNAHAKDFEFQPPRGRPRERRLDNEALAQTWLAMIGFSEDAVHRKRELFDEEKFYRLVFLSRTKAHGAEHEFNAEQALLAADANAPAPDLMLVSFLARELARAVPRPPREARVEAIQRLGLGKKGPDEVEAALAADARFMQSRILNGLSYVFVEFVGYVLFRAFGAGVHDIGPALLRTPSLGAARESGIIADVAVSIRREESKAGDVLPLIWYCFNHILDELLSGSWKEAYITAPVKTRFFHSTDTRTRIFKSFRDLEGFMERSQVMKPWAAFIPAKTSISQYLQTVTK